MSAAPFNYVSYAFPLWGYGFDLNGIDYAIAELADVTGRVQINPNFQQETISSSDFLAPGVNPYPGKPNMTPPESEIEFIVDKFSEAGLEIDFKFGANVADDTWSGLIDPSDPDAWFANYKALIMPWVHRAEELGSDSIVLTNEAMTLTDQHRENWVSLIADVREVYSGRIGVNSTVTGGADSIVFADQLDFLGLSLYVQTTEKSDPTVAELVAGWSSDVNGFNWLERIEEFHLTYELPIQITELAFFSYDGAAANGNYYAGDRSVVDLGEQNDQYEAFFQTFSNLPARWFEGVTFWEWIGTFPDTPWFQSPEGLSNAHIDGKPSEQTVRAWLSGDRQGEGITVTSTSSVGGILDGGYNHDTLTGGTGADQIFGGPGNDFLKGGGGIDVANGGTGSDVLYATLGQSLSGNADVAQFDGLYSQYEVRGGSTYAVVTDANGDRDKVFGFQFLRFDDRLIELDVGSALDEAGSPEDFIIAERVALLYEAALNRDGAIDLPGLNFYIDVAERDNLTDEFLANDMMRSNEFTTNFGDPETLSNAGFLEQIYLNVLDRTSDPAGQQFYLELLDAGVITKALALADIAISQENTIESMSVLMDLYESSNNDWSFL